MIKIEEMGFDVKAIINIFFRFFKQADINALPQKHGLRKIVEEIQTATDPDAIANIESDVSLAPGKKQEQIKRIKKIQEDNPPEELLKKIKFFYDNIYNLLEKFKRLKDQRMRERRESDKVQSNNTDEERSKKREVKEKELDTIEKYLKQFKAESDVKLANPAYTKLYYFAEQILTFFQDPSKPINFIRAYRILVQFYMDNFWHEKQKDKSKSDPHEKFLDDATLIIAGGSAKAEELNNLIDQYCFRTRSDPFVDLIQGLHRAVNQLRTKHQREEAQRAEDAIARLVASSSLPKPPAAAALVAHSAIFTQHEGVGVAPEVNSVVRQSGPFLNAESQLASIIQEMINAVKPSTQNIGPLGIISYLYGQCALTGTPENNTTLFNNYLREILQGMTQKELTKVLEVQEDFKLPSMQKTDRSSSAAQTNKEGNAYDPMPVRKETAVASSAEFQVWGVLLGDLIGHKSEKIQNPALLDDVKSAVYGLVDGSMIGRVESKNEGLKPLVDLVMINAYSRYLAGFKERNKLFPEYEICKEFLVKGFKNLNDWNSINNIGTLVKVICQDFCAEESYFLKITIQLFQADMKQRLLPLIVFYLAQYPKGAEDKAMCPIAYANLKKTFSIELSPMQYQILCGLAEELRVCRMAKEPTDEVEFSLPLARLQPRSDSVGSSRVDLQACKLEYSIVSPK